MAIFLLKLILWALSSLASLATFIIFRAVALIVVLFIQLFRVPGLAIEGALEHIAVLLRTAVECVFDLLKDGLVSLISSGVELVSGTATGSISLTTSAVVELTEKMKNAFDMLAEIFPEAFEGMSEMVGKMVSDLWDNYKDAVGYIIQNV